MTRTPQARVTPSPRAIAPPTQAAAARPSKQTTDSMAIRFGPHSTTAVTTHAAATTTPAAARVASTAVGPRPPGGIAR